MAKICLLGDTHIGARNDHLAFHKYFEKFYTNVFFPYLEENDIKTVVQFGDLFDRRKYINFASLSQSRRYLFDPLRDKGIDFHVFVGNHDTFYKNSNEVNSPDLLLKDYENITVYSDPTVVTLGDDVKYALLPWVCSGNYEESINFIKTADAQILFGHLELAGFEMHRGTFNDHGMEADLFSRYDVVCTGHFHHRSTRGNITYLGTPYELTWADYNDSRGFHIFDDQTRELEFVPNPYRMFNKIYYDDFDKPIEAVLETDLSMYNDTFVKVIVKNKTNPYWFDMFIDKLDKADPIDFQIVEDHLNLNLEVESDIVNEAEDTLTILNKVVSTLETNVPKKKIGRLLANLYHEALHQE